MALGNLDLANENERQYRIKNALQKASEHVEQAINALQGLDTLAMMNGKPQLATKVRLWRSLLIEIRQGQGPVETSADSGLQNYAAALWQQHPIAGGCPEVRVNEF